MQWSNWSRRGAALLAGSLFALATTPAAAQDFEGIITAKVAGMPGGGEMKTYVKGNRYRLEIVVPGQGAMAIIADPAAGETYMVVPSQSMYMVMKLSAAERMADSLLRAGGTAPSGEATMTALGKKEEVAGRTCEVYRMREGRSATDLCLATGIAAFRAGAGFFGGPPTPGRQRQIPAWARELARKGAFPLRVADTTGAMIWEVVSLELKSLEGSLFVPPAGFQRMEMPSFPTGAPAWRSGTTHVATPLVVYGPLCLRHPPINVNARARAT